MATPNLHLPSAAAEPLQVIGTGLGLTGTDSTPHLIRLLFVITLILLPSAAAEPLQVIGAGLGRTGTDSLRLALNELGFGPTYHMCEVLGVPGTLGDAYKRGHVDVWAELGEAGGEADERTWDDLFRGYRSTVESESFRLCVSPLHTDLTPILLARIIETIQAVQLAEKYPGAKVVLT
ncbi:hypothetical protein THAOC_01555, partial [Thalassiosira oceanica]